MAIVTSKRFVLPDTPEGLNDGVWFNMWAKKLWPYEELEHGDTLFWYESPSRCIVWRSKVVDVIRFPYERKKDVETKLKLTTVDAAQPYFVDAPDSGFCLSYRVEAIERVNLPKPEAFRFPQQGWLRIDDEVAEQWPGLAPA
jgi:hypothetical protein